MSTFQNFLDTGDIYGFKHPNFVKNPALIQPNVPTSKEYFKQHKDIFGFDKMAKKPEPDISLSQLPIKPISTTEIVNTLKNKKLGALPVQELWHNNITWGRLKSGSDEYEDGSIELDLSPMGSWKAIISRKITDLQGNPVWIQVQTIPLTDFKDYDEDVEEEISDVLWGNLQEAYKEKPYRAKKEYDMYPLAKEMNNHLSKWFPKWFLYSDIKKLPDDQGTNGNYVISYDCRGAGSGRDRDVFLLKFCVQFMFYPKTGLIKVLGYDIVSSIQNRSWKISPSEFDFMFSPEQDIKNKKYNSIVHMVDHAMRSY